MISHIFSKTKPVNFLLLSFLLAVYILSFEGFIGIGLQDNQGIGAYFMKNLGFFLKALGILVPVLFLIDFILKRNKLVLTHSYTLFFFVVFCGFFSSIFMNTAVLLAHFFVLLGLRRLLSLKTKQRSRKKVFEACLWFLVASYFYDWTLLYFLLLPTVIFIYDKNNPRYWSLILWAILVYAALLWGFVIRSNPESFFKTHYLFNYQPQEFSAKISPLIMVFYGSGALVLLWNYSRKASAKVASLGRKNSLAILTLTGFLGGLLYLFSPFDDYSALLFGFFPMAFLWSNTTELLPKIWQKELLLWGFLSAPLWGLIAYLVQN
tara:strand:- start:23 stop:985 length:963 start_codon:yes stop_codon:yes gene_type:complete